jgi:hypothetical protein
VTVRHMTDLSDIDQLPGRGNICRLLTASVMRIMPISIGTICAQVQVPSVSV